MLEKVKPNYLEKTDPLKKQIQILEDAGETKWGYKMKANLRRLPTYLNREYKHYTTSIIHLPTGDEGGKFCRILKTTWEFKNEIEKDKKKN